MAIPEGPLVCFLDEHDDAKSMLVGGFFLPRSRLHDLDETVHDLKEKYGVPEGQPVKWNLKDNSCAAAKRAIGRQVDQFRTDMFQSFQALDLRLLMSHVWKGAPSNRNDAWKWSFTNILQRLCIILDRKRAELSAPHGYPLLDVVFDWPPSNKGIDKYFRVYDRAYREGYTFENNTVPSLHEREACPCLLVSRTRFSLGLQATDMVVGAVGAFFNWVYEEKDKGNVRQHFPALFPLFHREDEGSVMGYGLVVKKNCRAGVESAIRDLGLIN